MTPLECLFCKIIHKELPADIVYEDETVLAFLDIHPRAPEHFLFVSKKHIASIKEDGAEDLARVLIAAAKTVARQKDFHGYKIVFNVGREAGQTIDHLHLHLLSGGPSELTI